MKQRQIRRLVAVSGAALMLATATGLQYSQAAADDGGGSVAPRSDGHFASSGVTSGEEKITLDDGRKVAMYYSAGKGLVEKHYDPKTKKWSTPKVIVRTATDPCQGITLTAVKGTVAAIADFGLYCSDGEPPTESVAAIGIGNLKTWEHHVTEDFDGWTGVTIAAKANKATFEQESDRGTSTLKWTKGKGFAEPVFPPETPARGIDGRLGN